MGRFSRVVAVGMAHHVTQRGNGRRFLLERDEDRRVYLDLLRLNLQLQNVLLVGFCLMSNHVHLVVIPDRDDALAQTMKQTHGRYASYWNAVHHSSGHAWQGRYYSCPLDGSHVWQALRYTELNPVRAGLVSAPQSWPFSSAAIHCGLASEQQLLSMDLWQQHWTYAGWAEYLALGEAESDIRRIRQCTHTGRPLGAPEFVQSLEKSMKRLLAPKKGGRPPKRSPTKEANLSLFWSKDAS